MIVIKANGQIPYFREFTRNGGGGGGTFLTIGRRAGGGGVGVGNALIFEIYFHRLLNILHMGIKR